MLRSHSVGSVKNQINLKRNRNCLHSIIIFYRRRSTLFESLVAKGKTKPNPGKNIEKFGMFFEDAESEFLLCISKNLCVFSKNCEILLQLKKTWNRVYFP